MQQRVFKVANNDAPFNVSNWFPIREQLHQHIGTKVVNKFHSACVPTVQGQHDPVKLIKIGSKIMQYGYKNSLNLYQMWNVNYIDQNCPDDF